MKMQFSENILNTIHAIRDYKSFIISDNYITKEKDFDWYKETEKYFYGLPTELNKSKNSLEAILVFPQKELNRLDNTEVKDLGNNSFYF